MHKRKTVAERLAQLERDSRRIDKVLVVLTREVGHLQEYATKSPDVKVAFAQVETDDKMHRERSRLERMRIKNKENMKYVS
jgi:hypothetical protein